VDERTDGTVVLASSGIDSSLAAVRYPEATLLFINHGQKEVLAEWTALRVLFPSRRIEHAAVIARPVARRDHWFVPARNLLLTCVAVRYGARIVLTSVADDAAADNNPIAAQAMSAILTAQAGYDVRVWSPFAELCKHEVVADYLRHGGIANWLRQTWSCYEATTYPKRCGQCRACVRWALALLANDIDVPMPSDAALREHLRALPTYLPRRQAAIRHVLERAGRLHLLEPPPAAADKEAVL